MITVRLIKVYHFFTVTFFMTSPSFAGINTKMNSARLLRVGSTLRGHIQSRGKAVQGYKRPSMDDLGVPTESWAVVNARTQKKYNAVLAVGIGAISVTLAYMWQSHLTVFYTVPRHLIEEREDCPKDLKKGYPPPIRS